MNIVQQAAEKISHELAKQFVGIQNHQINFADLIQNIQTCVNEIGVLMVESLISEADTALRRSPVRKREWYIQRNNDTKIYATLLGPIELTRTYYKHKKDGHFSYLLDDYMGILPYNRVDTGLETEILTSASNHSYQQTIEKFQLSGINSKVTVKNKVHRINGNHLNVSINRYQSTPKVLYIEADEDHVAYQDGKNRFMKLVYVHEGYQNNIGKGKRRSLKNCHYFSGLYDNNQDLWEEVYTYLNESYALENVKRIYLSGDGAGWIKAGLRKIPDATFVLDRFHVIKYVKKACIGLLSTTNMLLNWIDSNQKRFVKDFFLSRLSDPTLSNYQEKEILQAKRYLLNNWQAIQNQRNPDYIGCSAEGHVSHILSSRLSSRPLGWSQKGANNIAKLRVFLKNKGDLNAYFELKNKQLQKATRINRLDKRVNRPKMEIDSTFLAKLPLLENGQLTGSKYNLERLIK